MFNNIKKMGLGITLAMSVFLTGCGGEDTSDLVDKNLPLGEQLEYKITGIDAGAGVVQAAEEAMEDYGLDFTIQTSSGAVMTQALGDAIENENPIIVTAWTPHWKFAKYDLKYLEDPLNSFGGEEKIHTIVRLGLKEDSPKVYEVLDNFYWTPEDMEEVMLKVNDGGEIEDIAKEWVEENSETVSSWTEGIDSLDGENVKLAYVAWDSEIASTHIIGQVLKDLGADVKLTQVEAGPMWASVASGDSDGLVAAWLPGTHEVYINDYKDEVDDLGPNLEGAKIGLAVPSYMDIDSIEDLKEFTK